MTTSRLRNVIAGTLTLALLTSASAPGATNPEFTCRKGRVKATARHHSCAQNQLARYYGGSSFSALAPGLAKCRVKAAAVWAKLQLLTGTSCDAPRWVDNGDGTAMDNLTGLQWERKTDDGSIHDKDNTYTWTDPFDVNPYNADGTAFTSFVRGLTASPCFAGQCDWRLPSIAELSSILQPTPYPCTPMPCVDPVFGFTQAVGSYWSTTGDVGAPLIVWVLGFGQGDLGSWPKNDLGRSVRAVRDS